MKKLVCAFLMVKCVFPALDLTTINVDFNEIYVSTKLQIIELFNQGSAPISVDVLAQHSELLEAGEKKAIRASDGFLFFNAASNESFSSVKIRNVTGKQSQTLATKKKTVVVQLGQRHEVTVASPCSISGVQGQNTNFSWGPIAAGKISGRIAHNIQYESVELFNRNLYTSIIKQNIPVCWSFMDLYPSALKVQQDFQLKHTRNLLIVDIDGFLTKYARKEDFLVLGRELTHEDLITQNTDWLFRMIDESQNYVVFSSAFENESALNGAHVTLSFLKRIFSLYGRDISTSIDFGDDGIGHTYFGKFADNVFMASGRYPFQIYWDRKSSAINIMKRKGYQFSATFLFDDSQHQRNNFVRDLDGTDEPYSIYDEKLSRVCSVQELKLKHMYYALPGLAESHHTVHSTLQELFRIAQEKDVKAFVFPGKSGYFLYSILQKLKGTDLSMLGITAEIPELISLPFSGSPGNPNSSASFTKEQRGSLFSFWESLDLRRLAGQNICLFDCVATGNGLKSFLHNFLLFYKSNEQALPSVTFVSLKNYGNSRTTSDPVIFTVRGKKLSFNSPLLKGPQPSRLEPLLLNEFDYELLPFPVVHDANDLNGYHPDEFSSVRSLHSKDWGKLGSTNFSEDTDKSRWFKDNIVPEYISLIQSYRPEGQYSNLKNFRGPRFARESILDAFLKKFLRKDLDSIHVPQAFHYKKALTILNTLQPSSSIEHTTYRVWLTNPANASEPPEWATEFYIQSVELHPELEHFLWCEDKAILHNTMRLLDRSSVKINVREVREIRDRMKGVELYDLLSRQGYFVMACDILRLDLVRLFGGLYTDYGYHVRSNMTGLLDRFDIITNQFVGQHPLDIHCDTNILAARKGNPIIEKFMSFITDLATVRPVKNEICEIFRRTQGLCNPWTHGPYFTAFLYNSITPADRLLVLSGADIIEKKHMGTWWAGTSGNKSIIKDGYPVI